MVQQVKVFAMQISRPEFNPQNLHKNGRRGQMPQSYPLTSACASKYMHTQKHTQRDNILSVGVNNISLNRSQGHCSQGLYIKERFLHGHSNSRVCI